MATAYCISARYETSCNIYFVMGGQLVESRGELMRRMMGLQLDVMLAGAEMQYTVATAAKLYMTEIYF